MAEKTVGTTAWNAADDQKLRTSHLFTSESVTEGHPDKIADQISDALLDAALAKDPHSRVACETLVTTGLVVVAGELTTDCYVDIPTLVREKISEIGYTRAKFGFDAEWVVPHFEKMLYDNALLLRVYAHWWRLTRSPLAARITTET